MNILDVVRCIMNLTVLTYGDDAEMGDDEFADAVVGSLNDPSLLAGLGAAAGGVGAGAGAGTAQGQGKHPPYSHFFPCLFHNP